LTEAEIEVGIFREIRDAVPPAGVLMTLQRFQGPVPNPGIGGECRRSHQVAKHHGQVAALGIWRRGGRDRDSGRDRNRRGDPQIARGRRGGRLLGAPRRRQRLR
jgi:hypothetical protein